MLRFFGFLLVLLSLAKVTFADAGVYLGVGAGYGNLSTSTVSGFSYMDGGTSKSGSNFLGSIFAGFDFNRYVGIQADYYYLSDIEFGGGSSAVPQYTASYSATQQVIDLGIIGHFPFELFTDSLAGLSIFGKAAVGYSTLNFNGGYIGNAPSYTNIQAFPGFSQSPVPVLGLGVEYGYASVGVRLEYDYIGNTTVNNNSQNLINDSVNLGMLSVLYHF